MKSEEEKLKGTFILKEELLLKNDTRNDAKKISEIVDETCFEISESGQIFSYQPGQTFGDIDGVLYIDDSTVKLINLSEECKLLVYSATRVKKNSRMKSACSTIWKKTKGKWKIFFHQRTNCVPQGTRRGSEAENETDQLRTSAKRDRGTRVGKSKGTAKTVSK